MRGDAGSSNGARRVVAVVAIAVTVAAVATGCAAPPPAAPPPRITLEQAIAQGWEIVNTDGERLLCSKAVETGSHLRQKRTCMTEAELQRGRDGDQRFLGGIQTGPKPRMRGDLGH